MIHRTDISSMLSFLEGRTRPNACCQHHFNGYQPAHTKICLGIYGIYLSIIYYLSGRYRLPSIRSNIIFPKLGVQIEFIKLSFDQSGWTQEELWFWIFFFFRPTQGRLVMPLLSPLLEKSDHLTLRKKNMKEKGIGKADGLLQPLSRSRYKLPHHVHKMCNNEMVVIC